MPGPPVTIVVIPDFGVRLAEVVASGPVWIADTAENRQAAEARWQAGIHDVTTFRVSQPLDPEREASNILGQVLLHHPGSREIRVVGCHAGPAIRENFKAEGFEVSEERHEGFTARS